MQWQLLISFVHEVPPMRQPEDSVPHIQYANSEEIAWHLTKQLRLPDLVISDTDTIPGFLCLADNEPMLTKIYKIKKRAPEKRLLVLAASLEMAISIVDYSRITADRKKIESFLGLLWPGSLTCILPLKAGHSFSSALHQENQIAIRVPDQPWLRATIEQCGSFVAAPSANLSGLPVEETPRNIFRQFQDSISLYHFHLDEISLKKWDGLSPILDFTTWKTNQPSTIVDLCGAEPVLVRGGAMPWPLIQSQWHSYE